MDYPRDCHALGGSGAEGRKDGRQMAHGTVRNSVQVSGWNSRQRVVQERRRTRGGSSGGGGGGGGEEGRGKKRGERQKQRADTIAVQQHPVTRAGNITHRHTHTHTHTRDSQPRQNAQLQLLARETGKKSTVQCR